MIRAEHLAATLLSLATIGLVVMDTWYLPGQRGLLVSTLSVRGLLELAQLAAICWLGLVLVQRSMSSKEHEEPRRSRVSLFEPRASTVAAAVGLLLLVLALIAARLQADGSASGYLLGASLVALSVALCASMPREERTWLLPVAAVALSLRLAAAFALHVYGLTLGPRAIVLDDESAFDYAARTVLALIGDETARLPDEWVHLVGHHLSLLTALYGVFDPNPLVARLASALLGASVAIMGGIIARSLFGRAAALSTGLLLAAMPSLVIWSATLLRESLVGALVALVLWGVLRWRTSPSWVIAVLVVGALHVLSGLRLYVGIVLGLVVCVSLLLMFVRQRGIGRSHSRRELLVGFALLSLLFAWQLWPALVSKANPRSIIYQQTVMQLVPPPFELLGREADGASRVPPVGGAIVMVRSDDGSVEAPGMVVATRGGEAYFVAISRERLLQVRPEQVRPLDDLDAMTALRHVVANFGQGVRLMLLAPFGVGIVKPIFPLLAMDALLWLGLLFLAVVGVLRHREPFLLLPLGFAVGVLLVLVLVPGNTGNLMRHRAVLTMLPLSIVAAPALAAMAASLGRQATTLVRRVTHERLAAAFLVLVAGASLVANGLLPSFPLDQLNSPSLPRTALDLAELAGMAWLGLLLLRAPPSIDTVVPSRFLSSSVTLRWQSARRSSVLPAVLLLLLALGAGHLPVHEAVPALLFASALVLLGVRFVRRAPAGERSWLVPVMVAATGARLAATVALSLYGVAQSARPIVLDDESAFDYAARALVDLLGHPRDPLPTEWQHLEGHFLSFLAALYAVFGFNPIVARLAMSLGGIATVLLGAVIARTIFGRAAAVAVGLLLALMPSLVIWSTTLLKEALVSLLVLLVVWAVVRWRSAPSWSLAVFVLVCVHVLSGLRLPTGLILGALAGVAILFYSVPRLRRWDVRVLGVASITAGAVAVVAFVGLAWPIFKTTLSPTNLVYLQTVMRIVPSQEELRTPRPGLPLGYESIGAVVAIRPGDSVVDVPGMVVGYSALELSSWTATNLQSPAAGPAYIVATSPQSTVTVPPDRVRPIMTMDSGTAFRHLASGLLEGLSVAVLAPLNTGVNTVPRLLLGVDALLWQAVLVLALVGCLRGKSAHLLLPLAFALATILVLATVPGTPGNLVRHRTVLTFPSLALAAGPALVELARALKRRWPGPFSHAASVQRWWLRPGPHVHS